MKEKLSKPESPDKINGAEQKQLYILTKSIQNVASDPTSHLFDRVLASARAIPMRAGLSLMHHQFPFIVVSSLLTCNSTLFAFIVEPKDYFFWSHA